MGTPTPAIAFTVGDADTPVTSLTLSGGSSNTNLVSTNNIVFGGSGANRTVTVTPSAGQTGTSTITVTVSDGALSASDSFVLTVNAVNTPPTITGIGNQTINEDNSTGPLGFTIGDGETAAGSLSLSKASDNTTLVPANNIVFGGGGASRTITVSPAANQNGSATITVGVSDGQYTTSTNFVLTVNAVNDAPTLSGIANQTISINGTAGPLSFTVGDVDTAVGSLSLSKDSSNPTLVPLSGIVFGGSGASRTVTVTPVSGQSGSATITVGVSDGQYTTSTNFVLTVSALVSGTVSLTNGAAITIPSSGAASPYPSTINVSGLGTTASNVVVRLNGFNHTWANDVDVLLVGPGGQAIRLLENAGTGNTPSASLTFSNGAAASVPQTGALPSGTYRPTAYTPATSYPSPAPGGTYGTALTAFNGTDPNGTWSLYVFDDGPGDQGSIAGGWSLTITASDSGASLLSAARSFALDKPPQIISLTFDAKGQIQIAVTGQAGFSYTLEASSDLAHWDQVDEQDNATGSVVLSEERTTNSLRFYRVLSLPQ